MSKEKAIVLLSGGLDSATVLAYAAHNGYDIHALSFDYGQRHKIELECAAKLAHKFKVRDYRISRLDLRIFGGSALTSDIPVPKNESVEKIGNDIPVTYVPARNTIFLSYALAFAESIGAGIIFIGVNALDYSGYPDCRPDYIVSFERMANLATKAAINGQTSYKILTPLIDLSKADIIKLGLSLGVDYSITSSCYDPAVDGKPCGHCDACLLRLKGFKENGISDPVAYIHK